METSVNGTDLGMTFNRPRTPIVMHLQNSRARLSGSWAIGTMTVER